MTGSFGTVRENRESQSEDLTHENRFEGDLASDPIMRSLRWIVGRDLLMFSSASDAEVVRLPSRPKRLDDEQLWFPVSHRNAAIVGPVYPVGLRVSGPLLRVLCAEDVRFVCGADVRVSGEPARILGSLDAADPSRLRWLERKMHGLRADRLDSLDLLSDNSRKTSRNDLSPAATTMCSTIERDPVGAHHAAEFERKGARGILTVLEDRGLVTVLNTGQIVAATHGAELADIVRRAPLPLDPHGAAREFGTSVGLARAILDQFVSDGIVDRRLADIHKVRTHEES